MNILTIIPAYAWLLISAVFFAGGEYLSKRWALQPSFSFIFLVLAAYILGVLAWLPALLQKNQLATTGTAWSLLSVMATVAIGLVIFHEQLNVYQIAGIILATVALVLLNIQA